MTLTVDGQRRPQPEPLSELVLREVDLPVVHDAPLALWISAAAPPRDRRCATCGTKLVLASGYCSACTADMNAAGA